MESFLFNYIVYRIVFTPAFLTGIMCVCKCFSVRFCCQVVLFFVAFLKMCGFYGAFTFEFLKKRNHGKSECGKLFVAKCLS